MSEWQKIETAPKDGTVILAYTIHGEMGTVAWTKWPHDSWQLVMTGAHAEDGDCDRITHWMSLPNPPA